MTHRAKTGIVLLSAVVLLAAEAGVFWVQDWRYNLPTPRPKHLVQASLGERPVLPSRLERALDSAAGRPVLLHFFSPDCPCSRFNLDHVCEIARQFQGRVAVIAILQADPDDETAAVRESRRLSFPAIVDSDGEIAAACGVYSTPQAVILDADGRLLFRGNYNLSRYCTSRATEFARLALEAAVMGQAVPRFPIGATVAYGCALRAQTKN